MKKPQTRQLVAVARMLATCAHTPFGRITASTLRLSHTASALEMLKISHNLLATTKRLRQQLASERREFTRAMSKARRDLRHERERLVAAGCKPASAWSAFFPSKDRSKSHPLPHKGKDKSKLPLQTEAACLTAGQYLMQNSLHKIKIHISSAQLKRE